MRKPELGKYLLWRFFANHKAIRPYLPDTRRFTRQAFINMLNQYGMVYVKPSGGSMGRGVIKVWKSGQRVFIKKTVQAVKTFPSVDAAASHLTTLTKGYAYIVQRGIHLATIDGRPLDIRVMMQRSEPGGSWLYSGMLAKVAGPRSVVTNVALSRGYVLEVEDALKRSLGWGKGRINKMVDEMKRLSFTAAKHFDSYQRYRELGFDMAVDSNGKLWLIEENTGPSHPLFKRLKSNLSMYRRIEYRYGQFTRAQRKNQQSVNKRKK